MKALQLSIPEFQFFSFDVTSDKYFKILIPHLWNENNLLFPQTGVDVWASKPIPYLSNMKHQITN